MHPTLPGECLPNTPWDEHAPNSSSDDNRPMESFRLSIRTASCLKSRGIMTLGALVRHTEAELLRIPRFGPMSLNEIKEEIGLVGRHLGDRG